MTAYVVALVDVTDPDQYQEYAKRAGAAAQKYADKHGVEYLARGGRTVSLEGPAPRGRVVVARFNSVEDAEAFYSSPEYLEAKTFRENAATFQLFIVDGAD
jgi:uncharacterized protein (DUF1330 family)